MPDYQEIYYNSADGLRLYARDYQRSEQQSRDQTPLLCMHGLTRNSADFEDLCEVLANRYRLVVVDQRGRGRSAYDPNAANYNPLVYVQDMFALLRQLKITSVILLGTSMGGIMAMMMAAMQPDVVKALIINDIGPAVAPTGLARIQRYVGKLSPVTNWQEAVAQTKQINQLAFPDFTDPDWLAFAKRIYQEDADSNLKLAHDPAIATPIDASEGQSLSVNLWPVFEQISDKPILLIRGELSDILALECVAEMQRIKPNLDYSEIANVGHAPLLSEPAAVAAIQTFLQRNATSRDG